MTLWLAMAVSPALAANQQVQVRDDFFQAATVAVKPGEMVTWTSSNATRPHNVSFDDGTFTAPSFPQFSVWTTARTFSTPGIYRYHCQAHGGFGGQGMSGLVHVNESATIPGVAPTASFTVSPTVAAIGETVTLNAGASTDPDGTIAKYEWDFNGDSVFDSDTGTSAITTFVPLAGGARTIGLRVTDNNGANAQTTRPLTVTNRPVAQFTITPATAQIDQTVSFDATASSDADGTIAKYEWDLDGNGSLEVDGGASPTTTRAYAGAANLTVTLRVTDNLGVTHSTTRALQIVASPAVQAVVTPPPPPPPPPVVTPSAQTAPVAGCSTLSGAARATCEQKACRSLTGAKRASCISKSCRYLKGAKRASCIQASCRYVAKSRRAACARTSCRFLTAAKRSACVRRYRRP